MDAARATPIKYAEVFTYFRRPVPRFGILQLSPGQSPSGYGSKISTDIMVRFGNERRAYRVYCVRYSNAGSCYVVRGGERLYFKSTDFS